MSKIRLLNKDDVRPNYKLDRNNEIYSKYQQGGESYNTLARKYDLTPQAVSRIINRHNKKIKKLGGENK